MNWETIEGKWQQLKGEFKTRFSKLTDDDFVYLSGEKDVLVGKVRECYGITKEEAERQIDEWAKRIDPSVFSRDKNESSRSKNQRDQRDQPSSKGGSHLR